MAKVNFASCSTLAKYEAITPKDNNTLYFVTDAQRIYKGSNDVTSNVVVVSEFGEASAAFEGKFYVNTTTFEVRIKSGAAWIVLTPGYLTDTVNWAEASSSKFATIGLIKKGIEEAIAAIPEVEIPETTLGFDSETGKLSVDDKEETLDNVAHHVTYDASALKLTIKTYGGDDVVVNLPKDNFVRSGRYEAEYDLPDGSKGPAVVLVVDDDSDAENGTTEVVIPAADLVDVYTGGSGKTVSVTVGADNKITAEAIVDPSEGNALVATDKGLRVDISSTVEGLQGAIDGKMNKLAAGNLDTLVLNDGQGGVRLTEYKVFAGDLAKGTANDLPVATTIAAAITAAVSAAQGTLEDQLEALEKRVKDLEDAAGSLQSSKMDKLEKSTGGFVTVSDGAGNVLESAKKVGSSTEFTGTANLLADEAAVKAAIESAYSWGTI